MSLKEYSVTLTLKVNEDGTFDQTLECAPEFNPPILMLHRDFIDQVCTNLEIQQNVKQALLQLSAQQAVQQQAAPEIVVPRPGGPVDLNRFRNQRGGA